MDDLDAPGSINTPLIRLRALWTPTTDHEPPNHTWDPTHAPQRPLLTHPLTHTERDLPAQDLERGR
jgi:hypothetical protein